MGWRQEIYPVVEVVMSSRRSGKTGVKVVNRAWRSEFASDAAGRRCSRRLRLERGERVSEEEVQDAEEKNKARGGRGEAKTGREEGVGGTCGRGDGKRMVGRF
jgi:hypothetical protein